MASYVLRSLLFLASICALIQTSTSLARSTEASEFFIAFPRNSQFTSETLRVLVSTQESSPVYFSLTSDAFLYNYFGIVTNESVTEIFLPQYLEIASINDRNKGLRLRVTDNRKKVSVYATKDANLGSGGYLALPCEAYTGISSYTYFASSYLWGNRTNSIRKSIAVVIGCENNTQITISPSHMITIPADLRNNNDARTAVGPGESYTITVNKFKTVQLETVLDLTGTRFVTNKPIALLSGHECADVPINVPFCDYIIEQLPPTLTWGRFFFVVASNTRTAGERFRIITLKATTSVKVYCSQVGGLVPTNDFTIAVLQNAGAIHEFEILANRFCSVQANKPIQLVQYSTGYSLDNTGDPFMVYVPPVEQYTNNYTTKALSGFNNHLTLVVPLPFYNPNSIYVNGGLIPALSWSRVFCSNNVVCGYGTRLSLTQGVTYHVHHSNPQGRLAVFAYGFDYHSAYGYSAGMLMEQISDVCVEGMLRLDSSSQQTGPVLGGRVEVCVEGVWSSVCGRGWDDQDAAVVCRQLGYSATGAVASTSELPSANHTTWPYIFSSAECAGSEARLTDCSHDSGIAECGINEGAGVQCQQFPSPQVTVAIATQLYQRSETTLQCTIYIESALTNQITVSASTWEKDGQPLQTNDDITITSPYQADGNPNTFYSDVTIASLTMANEGTYSCTAIIASTITGAIVSIGTASTSIRVPERHSALFQLRLIGVGDCSAWLLQFSTPTEKAMEVIDDIISNIQSPCQCSITTNHITDAVFQCFEQNAHQVTFRARVYPTPQAEAMNIINNITAWSTSGASVSVHGVLLSVDPQCAVKIASLSAPECGGEGGTASPTTAAGTLGGSTTAQEKTTATTQAGDQVKTEARDGTTEGHVTTPTLGESPHTRSADSALNVKAIVGGSVAVVTVLIMAVAVTIVSIACLTLRFKRSTLPVAATNAIAVATGSTHTAEHTTYQRNLEKPPLEDHTYVDVATIRPHPPAYTPM